MPSFELTDGVKACIEMAEAALGVKNIVSGAATASSVCTHCPGKCRESTCFCFMQALETLSGENDTLKKENSQLVNLATAKGVSYIVRKRVYASCCCWLLCLGHMHGWLLSDTLLHARYKRGLPTCLRPLQCW